MKTKFVAIIYTMMYYVMSLKCPRQTPGVNTSKNGGKILRRKGNPVFEYSHNRAVEEGYLPARDT